MGLVELRGLRKEFGEVKAVNGVDLSIAKGEFVVILGPSGCGKTTLMRMVAGLEKPTEGEVIIDDRNVTPLPPRAREIAMVFQSYALYPHMSIFDNVAFPLKARKMPKNEIREKVGWATSILGIQRLLDRKPRQLSGGERQRVALARALVKEPAVMLLDEPLSNLDAKLRTSARDELQRFQRKLGITTIFVTHDQIEAMGLGDRIAVMNAGKVRQVGAPQEIYDDPADTFVATFLGSPPMNLMEQNGHLVGFRPENFLPEAVAEENTAYVTFPYHVGRVENLGSDRLLYGTVAGAEENRTISKLPSTVRVEVEPNETHEFVVRRQDLRFFDKKTGLRSAPQAF
ncbi:MAG TPA: ABC transporter ATP-binding protein [Candidatus Sulfomarinibacteraceae bacterium]|nr:ABC transporter ATP-binding protein [Candidatus Sulfomarinibacteraceae bacterium]